MATAEVRLNFPGQIEESRNKIRDSFKRSHEALRVRENILLSHVDEIENEYNTRTQEIQELLEALDKNKSFTANTLTSNRLTDTHRIIHSAIDKKITELTADTYCSIKFEWNNEFETGIEEIGSIQLNSQSMISDTCTFPPQVKPVVPDYKSKQLPTAVRCNKFSEQKAPGELNSPRGIAVSHNTGNIYIVDTYDHCIQVFNCDGDYLFMFCENMDEPVGICVFHNKVVVTQWSGNCINTYGLEGKLLRSVGTEGNGEAQFKNPIDVDVSCKDNSIYVCDFENARVQILTEELEYLSMLGIGLFNSPLHVKVTRNKIFVLDKNDPCFFVFNSEHVLTNRLISRGVGKQTHFSFCFDIDRDYNIIMSDYRNHCVYIFNQEGELFHRFGKEGQGIGEFYHPYGIVLDNTGRIVVVCEKNNHCLQFF